MCFFRKGMLNDMLDYSYGVRADYVPADLSEVTDIETLWLAVTSLYSDGIDILVNSAG